MEEHVNQVNTDDCPFKVNALFRWRDPTYCNTIYKVTKVKKRSKEHSVYSRRTNDMATAFDVTVVPVFGLFKQDYKTKKKISIYSDSTMQQYELLGVLELGLARARFDNFINQEVRSINEG